MLEEVKDIKASLWISASAGTGKTKSLIDRILALLLNGVEPSKILCLTYTNAAAAEMLTRLAQYFHSFQRKSDQDLKDELEKLGFYKVSLDNVRSLYEKSMISANWVQIKTIHSFCFNILEKFPLETGLLPKVKICDTYQMKCLIRESIQSVLSSKKLDLYFKHISIYTTDLSDIIEQYSVKITNFLSKFDNFEKLYSDFFKIKKHFLFLSEKEQNSILFDEIFLGEQSKIFLELSRILHNGSSEDIKKAEILLKNSTDLSDNFIKIFLTEKGTIRSRLCTKKLSDSHPLLLSKMHEIALKTLEFCEQKKRYISANTNISLFYILKEIINNYNNLKIKKHFIDFNDIISMTSMLLQNIDWVMYKIDGGIEHILIDEAQDTSPEQWNIIKTITDEFFTNYQSEKTVFVVGDEKQSIYSFQGADILLFQKMHKYFKLRSERNGQKFYDVTLNKSYRTTGNILSFVDEVFVNSFPLIKHKTYRSKNSGFLEITDLFNDDEIDEAIPWDACSSIKDFQSSGKKLANYIASLIHYIIDNKIFVESKNRSAIPSDFLILFQRRNIKSMKNIIKALKERKIPVTEIDRVLLKDELIVEDLIAFSDFSLLPLDDLACARILKSPIVGITEEELMNLCINRKEQNLWNYILSDDSLCKKYELNKLVDIISNANNMSAYDYFMYALNNGIKEKFLSRLGKHCLDIVSEFLDVVLTYENENNASLQSFIQWFKSFEHEIKRDCSLNQNAVRLMTVHASKGLQSPFVIIADAHFFKISKEIILNTENGILIWNFCSETAPKNVLELIDIHSKQDIEESRRLLYVAMTRAEDFLYILGENKKNIDNCWMNFIRKNILHENFKKIEFLEKSNLRIGSYIKSQQKLNSITVEKKSEIPNWFFEKLPIPLHKDNYLEIKTNQMLFGDCVHMLLNEMPFYKKYSYEEFDMFADIILSKFNVSENIKKEAKVESYKILNDEKFEFIFNKNALSEVTILYAGEERRIDKIAVDNKYIWIIDFKTGNPSEIISNKYIKQLLEYKKAVSEMINCGYIQFENTYTVQNIKTAILWTKNSELVEVLE